MPEFKRYKHVSEYQRRTSDQWASDIIGFTMELASGTASIASGFRKASDRHKARMALKAQAQADVQAAEDAQAQYDQAVFDTKYMADRQSQMDWADLTYSEQIATLGGELPEQYQIGNLTYDTIRPYIPEGMDFTQQDLDVWQRNRSYTQDEAAAGITFGTSNIVDKNISSGSNAWTRMQDAATAQAELDSAEAVNIDERMRLYMYGSETTDEETGVRNVEQLGYIGKMEQIVGTDISKIPEEMVRQVGAMVDVDWIVQNMGATERGAKAWIDEYGQKFADDMAKEASDTYYSALAALRRTNAETAIENIRPALATLDFNEAYDYYITINREYGADMLTDWNEMDRFVEFTAMYVNDKGSMILDADPTIPDHMIEDYVTSFVDDIVSQYGSTLGNERVAKLRSDAQNTISEMKEHKVAAADSMTDRLRTVSGELDAKLSTEWNANRFFDDAEIWAQFGITGPTMANSIQLNAVMPLIEKNAQARMRSALATENVAFIERSANASAKSATDVRPLTITFNQSELDETRKDIVSIRNEGEDAKRNMALTSGITARLAEENPQESRSPLSFGFDIGSSAMADISTEVKVNAYTRNLADKYNRTIAGFGQLYDGTGMPEDGDEITVVDGDGFLLALEQMGIDLATDTDAAMKLAYVWNTEYEYTQNYNTSQAVAERTMDDLRRVMATTQREDFENLVYSNYTKLGNNENVKKMMDEYDNQKYGADFMTVYYQAVDDVMEALDYDEDAVYSTLTLLNNDTHVMDKLHDYWVRNGSMPPVVDIINENRDFFLAEPAKNLNKAKKELGVAFLADSKTIPSDAASVMASSSTARNDYRAWNNGTALQMWRFDDSFFEDVLTTAVAGNIIDDTEIINSAVQALTDNPNMTYDDLSDGDKLVVQRNAGLAAYMAGSVMSLRAALGSKLETGQWETVKLGNSGDIGILDRVNSLVYYYPYGDDDGTIMITKINMDSALDRPLGAQKDAMVPAEMGTVSKEALRATGNTEAWDRGFYYEVDAEKSRLIASGRKDTWNLQQEAKSNVRKKTYMTADGNYGFARAMRNLGIGGY